MTEYYQFFSNSINYAPYDSTKTVSHTPQHNGGLYTGIPFKTGASYADVPVIPTADYMTRVNLRSSQDSTPPQAFFQQGGSTRPGNNKNESKCNPITALTKIEFSKC